MRDVLKCFNTTILYLILVILNVTAEDGGLLNCAFKGLKNIPPLRDGVGPANKGILNTGRGINYTGCCRVEVIN